MTQKFVTLLNIAFPFIFTQIKKNQTKQVTRGGNNNLGGGGGGNDGPGGGGFYSWPRLQVRSDSPGRSVFRSNLPCANTSHAPFAERPRCPRVWWSRTNHQPVNVWRNGTGFEQHLAAAGYFSRLIL